MFSLRRKTDEIFETSAVYDDIILESRVMVYIFVCKKVNHEQNDRQQPEDEQETAAMTATGTESAPEDDQQQVSLFSFSFIISRPFSFSFVTAFRVNSRRGCQGKKEEEKKSRVLSWVILGFRCRRTSLFLSKSPAGCMVVP